MVSPLRGCRVVVTAGGTREPIDPVRYLGNRSSGRMGNAVAIASAGRGASVTLITTAAAPAIPGIEVVRVETAAEMNDAVRAALPGAALLVMVAAVADYRVADVAARKIKKSGAMTVDLVPTVDILGGLVGDPVRAGVIVVGFAAETDNGDENALAKLSRKAMDLVVLNDVSRPDIGMGSEDNEVTVFDDEGLVTRISRRPKPEVADALLDIVERRIAERSAEAARLAR